MTAIQALREQVKKNIDKADEKSLRMVQAILEIEEAYDFWDELPSGVKKDVNEALEQSGRGEGIPHKQVMKKYA